MTEILKYNPNCSVGETYMIFYIPKIYHYYQISNDIQFCNNYLGIRKSREPSLFLALVVDWFLLVPLLVTKFEI